MGYRWRQKDADQGKLDEERGYWLSHVVWALFSNSREGVIGLSRAFADKNPIAG